MDLLQEPQAPVPKPQIVFDIKVEIESCDEDADLQAEPVEVKAETLNENDLFETEDHDISELARSLSKRDQVTVKKESQDIHSEEQDANNTGSALTGIIYPSTAKRKRVPNKKHDYDYSIDDDEENDINELANMLIGNKSGKKDKKHDRRSPKNAKAANSDISKKMELWKNLDVDVDVDIDEREEISVVDEEDCKKTDNLQTIRNTTVAKLKKPFNPCCILQTKVSEDVLLEELDKLSKTTTETVDKILEIEMRNLWGRVRHIPHKFTNQQTKLLSAIEEWRVWSCSCKNKDPPTMYKCYVCEKAWWNYSEFDEHLVDHREDDLRVRTEINFHECYIVAYHYKTVVKHFPIDSNCWRCGKEFAVHVKVHPQKPGKSYRCNSCNEFFTTCKRLREHEGKCPKSLIQSTDDIQMIQLVSCSVCSYIVADPGVLEEHMKVIYNLYNLFNKTTSTV